MSNAIHTLESAEDFEGTSATGRQRETIAALLSEGAPAVVRLQTWLAGEKGLVAASASPQLFVGHVEDYSQKALKVTQPERDREAFVPKSASEAYRLADGVSELATPQTGLAEFEERGP